MKNYEKSMLRYLQSWIDQLRWQRLTPLEKLAGMLLKHRALQDHAGREFNMN